MNTPARRMLKIDEVCAIIGMKKSSVYRWASEGTFPAPKKVGPKASRWDSLAVNAWLEERLTQ